MRFSVAAVVLLLATTRAALAQPGATEPTNYGPPAPGPASTYAPAPQPTYYPPQQPTYAPGPQPTYYPQQPTYAPAPQPYYPAQPAPAQPPQAYQYQPRPYAPLYGAPLAASVTQPAPPRQIKSESNATWLSIGATAAGISAIYVAVGDNNANLGYTGIALTLIGPSVGHIYAGETGHAVKMSLLRTAGLVTLVYGAFQAESYNSGCDSCNTSHNDGKTTMLVGGAVLVGATLYDFYDAGRAARRTNERAARAFMVAPTMMSTSQGASPGVAVAGQF